MQKKFSLSEKETKFMSFCKKQIPKQHFYIKHFLYICCIKDKM